MSSESLRGTWPHSVREIIVEISGLECSLCKVDAQCTVAICSSVCHRSVESVSMRCAPFIGDIDGFLLPSSRVGYNFALA